MPKLRTPALAALASLALAFPLRAQDRDRASVLAIADSALAMITKGDVVGFTDLMVPEAVLFPTVTRDGVTRAGVRTRIDQRNSPFNARVDERGWNPEVKIHGGVAMVWYPYDLYIGGKWSHCGVDLFTLVKHEGRWRIASMAWSAEQPPACDKHPAGPPTR